jgi:hypothetical protein
VNHYGDAPELHTPNLQLLLQVSTLPWAARFPSDDRPWIAPDLAVPSTFASWTDGRDRALEAVIDAVLRGSLARRMITAAKESGTAAGVAARDAWRKQYPNPWDDGLERRPLRYAVDLMDEGNAEDAEAVAAVLARSDTTSYTAWRVLGEAQIALGKGPRAVHSLRRALALQPRSAVARLMLERLGEKP